MYNIKQKIVQHLIDLSEEDRYSRFGSPVKDEFIEKYVENIKPDTSDIFFVFNNSADIIAFCHLARYNDGSADIGLSVSSEYRKRGLGKSLLNRAVSEAKVKGYKQLYVYYLADNSSMYHLIKKAGFAVMPYADQCKADITLENPTIFDIYGNVVSDYITFCDNNYKLLFSNWRF